MDNDPADYRTPIACGIPGAGETKLPEMVGEGILESNCAARNASADGTNSAGSVFAIQQLLTVTDVSAALKVSERTVRRWIADGHLPVVRLGRTVRIRPPDLARLAKIGLRAAGTVQD